MRLQFQWGRITRALLVLSLAAPAACNNLLDVETSGRLPIDALDDPALIPNLAAGAIQTLQCGAMAFAATGGMLSGEYLSGNGFVNNHIWEWRSITDIKANPGTCNVTRTTTSMGFYTPLQQARFQLDDTFGRADKATDAEVPNRALILTQMRAYAGYAYLLLAEGLCQMTVDGGPAMTKQDVLAIAEQRFSDAITRATAITGSTEATSLLNMALVGRARTRLDLGKLPEAAADAILVPAGFVRNAEFSNTVQARENRYFNLTVRNDYLSVGPDYINLTVNGVADPRVKVQDMARNANDGITHMYRQLKFRGDTSNLAIASWAEAQLIYAEAVGGQAGLDAVNRVRASNSPAIAPIAGPAPTGTDWRDLVLEERRRQLFSEGQRYVDMLRYNLPFQMGINGVNRKGQTFSNLTCVPLPDVETRNNPNFSS
jgi:starch-binding outer membrane protein, SusD/RagB family